MGASITVSLAKEEEEVVGNDPAVKNTATVTTTATSGTAVLDKNENDHLPSADAAIPKSESMDDTVDDLAPGAPKPGRFQGYLTNGDSTAILHKLHHAPNHPRPAVDHVNGPEGAQSAKEASGGHEVTGFAANAPKPGRFQGYLTNGDSTAILHKLNHAPNHPRPAVDHVNGPIVSDSQWTDKLKKNDTLAAQKKRKNMPSFQPPSSLDELGEEEEEEDSDSVA